jgi:hypothetical protein
VTAGERYRARVRAYQTAFSGVPFGSRWTMALALLGFARYARRLVDERSFLAVVLADLRRYCGADPYTAIFVEDDPSGRISAYNEGMRQAYLHLERLLAIPSLEVEREAARLDREERVSFESHVDAEVRRIVANAR